MSIPVRSPLAPPAIGGSPALGTAGAHGACAAQAPAARRRRA
ncbi:hypothetical protein ACFXCU_02210 [Streptomyces virginiae]